jgi:hypothetical protein
MEERRNAPRERTFLNRIAFNDKNSTAAFLLEIVEFSRVADAPRLVARVFSRQRHARESVRFRGHDTGF